MQRRFFWRMLVMAASSMCGVSWAQTAADPAPAQQGQADPDTQPGRETTPGDAASGSSTAPGDATSGSSTSGSSTSGSSVTGDAPAPLAPMAQPLPRMPDDLELQRRGLIAYKRGLLMYSIGAVGALAGLPITYAGIQIIQDCGGSSGPGSVLGLIFCVGVGASVVGVGGGVTLISVPFMSGGVLWSRSGLERLEVDVPRWPGVASSVVAGAGILLIAGAVTEVLPAPEEAWGATGAGLVVGGVALATTQLVMNVRAARAAGITLRTPVPPKQKKQVSMAVSPLVLPGGGGLWVMGTW